MVSFRKTDANPAKISRVKQPIFIGPDPSVPFTHVREGKERQMTYDYTSIGFITFDALAWPVTELPPNADTFFVEDFTLAVSGAAGTAVIAAAKMGLKSLAVGGVGDDLMGEWVLRRLKDFDIDITGMATIKGGRTSSSVVTTRPNGMRPALHLRGATADFFVDDVLMEQATDARVVHIGGIGLMDKMDRGRNAELMKRARQKGAKTTLDVFAATPADMAKVADVLPHVDYFMPSDEEAKALTGLADIDETAQFFLDKGVTACVLTRGAQGAYYRHQDGTRFTIPAFEVSVKCTCGCGDAFNAGFAVAIVKGFDAETSVRFAQATSALNATGLGSQAGVIDFDHTWAFMNTNPVKKV
jgi:sugar/nucleoside kinase (ribokinase family)